MADINNWGFKISQPGFDVKTCADKDLVMSSSFNMLKTKLTGNTQGTVAHGLSYIPIFFTSFEISDGGTYGSIIGDDYNTVCNSTNLIVVAPANLSWMGSKYYIFYQQGIA